MSQFTLHEIDILMQGLDAYQQTKIDKALLRGLMNIVSAGRENADAAAAEADVQLHSVEDANNAMDDFITLLKAKLIGLKDAATVARVEEMLNDSGGRVNQ